MVFSVEIRRKHYPITWGRMTQSQRMKDAFRGGNIDWGLKGLMQVVGRGRKATSRGRKAVGMVESPEDRCSKM